MISHTFHINELHIGGSLETLLYSYVTETPLIIDEPHAPIEIVETHPDLDFSFLGFRKGESVPSLQLWDRLTFLLSLGGLILFPNSIETIREESNKLTVVTQNMKRVEVLFNKLRKFDTKFTNYTWIYDWFAVRSGGKHDVDLLEDENYLVKELKFYPSRRANVRGTKDVVAISYVKSDEIFDMECSEGYVTLKTKSMMKQAGIRGTSLGFLPSGLRRYQPIKIEHIHRQYQKQLIPDMTIGQILEMPRNEQGELCKLTRNLFKRRIHSI